MIPVGTFDVCFSSVHRIYSSQPTRQIAVQDNTVPLRPVCPPVFSITAFSVSAVIFHATGATRDGRKQKVIVRTPIVMPTTSQVVLLYGHVTGIEVLPIRSLFALGSNWRKLVVICKCPP